MGILIRQENNTWIIEIREQWTLNTPKERDDLLSFLNTRLISYKIEYDVSKPVFCAIITLDTKYDAQTHPIVVQTTTHFLNYKNKFVKVDGGRRK